jgi:hypothetical protein
MNRRMARAMNDLINDRANGDTVVSIIGFSRGGIQATEFANRVAKNFPDETIKFVGLFDPVGSVGHPGGLGPYRYHLPSGVLNSAEALADNENRTWFPATLVNVKTTPVWFPGTHSDIGGAWADTELGDYVCQWMVQQAQAASVGIDLNKIETDFAPWDPNLNGCVTPDSFDNVGATSFSRSSGGRVVLGVGGAGAVDGP